MPSELLAAAPDLRVWLELEADDVDSLSDERAELLLSGVSTAVLRYCHRQSFASVGEEGVRVDGSGSTELVVSGHPVTAVAKVVEDPDGDATEITAVVDWSEDGILERTDGRFVRRRRWYAIDYTHGYEQVPEDVRNVVLRVAARSVSNPEGLATEGTGGYNAGFAFDDTRLPTLSAPDRRELDPYRL